MRRIERECELESAREPRKHNAQAQGTETTAGLKHGADLMVGASPPGHLWPSCAPA